MNLVELESFWSIARETDYIHQNVLLNELNMMPEDSFLQLAIDMIGYEKLDERLGHNILNLDFRKIDLDKYVEPDILFYKLSDPNSYYFSIKDNDVICSFILKIKCYTSGHTILFTGYIELEYSVNKRKFISMSDDLYNINVSTPTFRENMQIIVYTILNTIKDKLNVEYKGDYNVKSNI